MIRRWCSRVVTTKNDFYLRLAAAGGVSLGLAQQPDKVNANHWTAQGNTEPRHHQDWKLESKAGPGSLAWTQAAAPPGDSWENMDGSHILIQDIHRGNGSGILGFMVTKWSILNVLWTI